MTPARPPIIEAALTLAWSHWTGLGVRGAVTAPDCAVDPESLIYLTAALAEFDPRLWNEAGDWWARFSDHLSGSRMNHLGARFGDRLQREVNTRAAVSMAAGLVAARPSKARLDDLRHPARSLLRLRCAFGTSARAEIMLALLTDLRDASEGATALTLAEVGYSKRNVAAVLQDLTMAGLIVARPDVNRVRYHLAQPDALRRLLAPIPRLWGRWYLRMPPIARFVDLAARLRGKDALLQAVEARALLTKEHRALLALGLEPPWIATAEAYWDGVQRWLINDVIRLPDSDLRQLPGQLVGHWLGPGEQRRPDASPTGAILPPLGVDVGAARELACLDLVQVSTIDPPGDWTWLVLSDAAVETYTHTLGLRRGERWRFTTTIEGAPCTFAAHLGAPLPPPDIAAAYGDAAAARARQDRAAVRVVLTRE